MLECSQTERWLLRVQPTSTKCVTFPPERTSLSRLTKIAQSQGCVQDEEYMRKVTLETVPVALRIRETEQASSEDEELNVVEERTSGWRVYKHTTSLAGKN